MKKYKLILLFLAAISVRLGYVLLLPQPGIVGDSGEYHSIAVNIVNGNGFSMNACAPTPARAPFYPFFLSIIYFLTGFNYLAVQIAQILLDSFTCLIIYFTSKDIFGEKTAWLSGILFAVYPPSAIYSRFILSEVLFTFLYAVSIFFLVKGLSSRNKFNFLLAGIFLGISALTRPTTVLFSLFAAGCIIFTRQRSFAGLFIYILATYLMIMPWTIRNYSQFGVFLPISIGGASNTWTTGYQVKNNTSWDVGSAATQARIGANAPEPVKFIKGQGHPKIDLDKQLLAEGKEMIKAHQKEYIMLLFKRLPVLWITSHSSAFNIDKPLSDYYRAKEYFPIFARLSLLGFQTALLFAALIGIVLSVKAGVNYSIVPLSALIYFCGHILFDPCPRFHIPVLPYVIMFASYFVIVRRKGEHAE